MTNRKLARELATEAIRLGRPLDWFERLYREANGDHSPIPWADMDVNPNLTSWVELAKIDGAEQNALVIGCGLGDDAEALGSIGFNVTAFDISVTCIQWCIHRFPQSAVSYCVMDLFDPPAKWNEEFDFVFEGYTLQVLPSELRAEAIKRIAQFAAPNGRVLIVARGRDEGDDPGQMPWPLTRTELGEFLRAGLREVSFEDYADTEEPPVRRFRVEYERPS